MALMFKQSRLNMRGIKRSTKLLINSKAMWKKADNELLVLSNKRVSDLHTLHDFISSAHSELTWLNEKEEAESNRDWADKNLVLSDVERYYEQLMGELENRESHFSSVQ